jgi:FK506-binding protein 2
MAAFVLGVIALTSSEDSERLLWKIQHTLGAAQISEKRGELQPAIDKISEAEALLTNWKSEVAGKIRSALTAQSAAETDTSNPNEPIDFEINRTSIPDDCPQVTQIGSVLKIHYVAKLLETGKVFSSSFHTGSMPFRFTLGGKDVVEGWNRGLVGMCTGERRRLLVPFTLGYGATSVKGVPPFSNLRYDIELVEQSRPKDEV